MALLVTIVTSGPAQVPIFPTGWLVVATITIVLSQGLGRIAPNSRDGVLGPKAARAAITTISIAPTVLVVSARSFRLGALGVIRKHSSCLVRAEWKGALVPGVILGRFLGGAMAWGQQASILRIHKRTFKVALASAVIVFLMARSQVSFWRLFCSAWAQMKGLRPS